MRKNLCLVRSKLISSSNVLLKSICPIFIILTSLPLSHPVKTQLERPQLPAVVKNGGGLQNDRLEDPIISQWLQTDDKSSNNGGSGRSVFDMPYDLEGAHENWIPPTVTMGRSATGSNEEDTDADLPDSGTSGSQENIKFVAEWNQTTIDYEFLIELTAEYYCERFGSLHVLCAYQNDRPGIVYHDRGVNELKLEFILAYLIRLRKRLLLGKEDGPNPGGTMQPLPKALRIRSLVWSEELQVVAQKIANQVVRTLNGTLIYATDKFSKLTVTIAMSADTQDRPRWTHALDYWHKQVVHVPQDVIFQSDGNAYRDYSAIVWGDSFQVGCGFVSVGGKKDNGKRIKVYVCAFGPGGNVPGKKIYITDEEGEPSIDPTTERPDEKDVVTKRPMEVVNPFDKLPKPHWETVKPVPKPPKPTSRTTTTIRPPKIITQHPPPAHHSESEETTEKPGKKSTTKKPKPSKTTTENVKPPARSSESDETTEKPAKKSTTKKPKPSKTTTEKVKPPARSSESDETTEKPAKKSTTKKPKPSKTTTEKVKPPVSPTKSEKTTAKPNKISTTKKPKPSKTTTVKAKPPPSKKTTPKMKPTKSTTAKMTTTKAKSTTAEPKVTKTTTMTPPTPPPEPPKFEPDIIIFDNKTRKHILQNPFMVLIYYGKLKDQPSKDQAKESHICSGTIYNGQWILTSYYCALPTLRRERGEPTHKVATVFYGELILKIGIPDEDFRFVTQAVVPPELDITKMGLLDNLDTDIALLKINKKITHSKYTKAIKLAFDPILYEGGEFSQFVGWTIERKDNTITAVMRKMKLTIQSSSQSTKTFSTTFNTEVRFSAKVTIESKDEMTCNADNGGALVKIVLLDNHQAPVPTAEIYILGILPVSLCQRQEIKVDTVGVEYYTKVFKWIKWVSSVAGEQDM